MCSNTHATYDQVRDFLTKISYQLLLHPPVLIRSSYYLSIITEALSKPFSCNFVHESSLSLIHSRYFTKTIGVSMANVCVLVFRFFRKRKISAFFRRFTRWTSFSWHEVMLSLFPIKPYLTSRTFSLILVLWFISTVEAAWDKTFYSRCNASYQHFMLQIFCYNGQCCNLLSLPNKLKWKWKTYLSGAIFVEKLRRICRVTSPVSILSG